MTISCITTPRSTSWSFNSHSSQVSFPIFRPNSGIFEYRMIFSCIMYCIVYMMQEIFQFLYTSNFNTMCLNILKKNTQMGRQVPTDTFKEKIVYMAKIKDLNCKIENKCVQFTVQENLSSDVY